MKVLTVDDIRTLIHKVGLSTFFKLSIDAMETDFCHWNSFNLTPRHPTYFPDGVIELMPCSDNSLYSLKYVSGHPDNPAQDRLSIVALGLLSDVNNGYPLMICEMTLLTAIRTAIAGVLAAKYLARSNANKLAIIGTGAQAEFQVQCFAHFFPLNEVLFFDRDPRAMQKFEKNLAEEAYQLIPCQSIKEAVYSADIIVTSTAAKKQQSLFKFKDITPGTHIHAMGGDCPGKTEFDISLLERCKLVVEYLPQSLLEGESQQGSENLVYAELWELICNKKKGRVNAREITLFDSVGFALEDFSMMRTIYTLAQSYRLGTEMNLIPELQNPKNLYSLIR